ncbi:MAG: glycosyltransferase [Pirellulales bacterium]
MSAFYGWLSVEPPILLHTSSDDLLRQLPESPVTRIQVYPWHHTADEIFAFHEHDRRLRPQDRLHHCVNTEAARQALEERGASVAFVTPNAFLDERRYTLAANASRLFQAVYNARMNPFKRHWLAERIGSLMIVGGVYAPDDSWDYFSEVRRRLPQAWFTHADNHWFRGPEEIAALLNEARVGLCLSACEGAMYAATEYLLCGLPVVSTASLGGRDVWFDPKYTRIVDDDPAAVAAAVDELDSLRLPPAEVRGAALREMAVQRERFFELGRRIYGQLSIDRSFVADFHAHFENKLGDWRSPQELSAHREQRRASLLEAKSRKSIDDGGPLLH